MADRQLTDDQVAEIEASIKAFTGQEFAVTTYWDIKECMAISNRIYAALVNVAGWNYIKPEAGRWLMAGISGIQVYVNPKAEEKTITAAAVLVRALQAANLDAQLRDENDPTPNNRIEINVGVKP